jgi:Spy/CpxP family protein refolding chaperone
MNCTRPVLRLILIAALAAPLAVRAAEEPPKSSPSPDRRAQARERLQSTLRELELDAKQREQLGAVLRDERERLTALRDDRQLAPRERLRRLQEAREEVNHRVKTILTPEQFARWERMCAAEPGPTRGGADRKAR